ncbi:MAG: serine hydrolase domain-containing protein [Lachnospiraceae bacterium]
MKQTDYIDRLITSEISRNNLAGANILLLKNEKELYCQSYGMADIERGIPMTRDSLFRIFSMTKPVTCAAVMLLMERGMLDLYDPVSRYLPGFRNQTVLNPDGSTSPVVREMQIRDLLNMTSGLSYPDDCTPVGKMVAALFDEMTDAQDAGHGFSTVTLANRLGQLPLCYHPGSRWQYSTSADVLGAVVEVVSGKRFSDFLKKEFFLPLEMPDTDFYVPDDKKHRFTQLYRCTPQSMFAASQLTDVVNALSSSNMTAPEQMNIRPELGKNLGMEGYAHRPVFESGGAGLVSTIDDYAHFATMLLQKGTYHGKRILSPKTAAFMCSPQLDDSFAKDLNWDSLRGYRYGNLMRYLVNRSDATNADLGEFGWDGWCGTYFTVDPSEDFIMLYFVQRCDTGCNEVTRRLKTMSYALL